MRHVAHFCVAFLAESDAEATPMRHDFGPKRRSVRRDAKKASSRKRLPVAHQCTKVTHGVHSLHRSGDRRRCAMTVGATLLFHTETLPDRDGFLD
jgi:hypothetical protein